MKKKMCINDSSMNYRFMNSQFGSHSMINILQMKNDSGRFETISNSWNSFGFSYNAAFRRSMRYPMKPRTTSTKAARESSHEDKVEKGTVKRIFKRK